MADRYWVGGSGNWSDDTNHWAATTGGLPGTGNVPTSGDNAIFDALSNATAYTVTMDVNASCLDLNFSAAPLASGTITWAGSLSMNVYGSVTLLAGMTNTYAGAVVCSAVAAGKTITCNGVSLNSISFGGVGGWTLQDALVLTRGVFPVLLISNGTLDTNGQAVSCHDVTMSGSSSMTVTLGASTITASATLGWDASTATSLTLNAGTSSIVLTRSDAVFNGAGQVYNAVTMSGSGVASITGDNTFSSLSIPSGSGLTLPGGSVTTVAGIAIGGGTPAALFKISSTTNNQYTINKTGGGTVTVDRANIGNCIGTPSSTWFATNSVDAGLNSGWDISPKAIPKIDYTHFPLFRRAQ